MIQISEKMFIYFQKVTSVKKLSISNGESFLESVFVPN